jgi:hypothetical protein
MSDENNIIPLPQKEIQAKVAFLQGKAIADISKELSIPVRTLYHWRDVNGWVEEKKKLDAEKNFLVEKYKKIEEIGDDLDKLSKYNISELAKASAIGIAKLQRLIMSDNPLPFIDQIQKAAAALEKLQTAIIKNETKGVVEHKHSGKIEKIDYAELAKIYTQAKREGKEFDDKGHLEKIITLANEDYEVKKGRKDD